jgi:anti-anti-sigma factor
MAPEQADAFAERGVEHLRQGDSELAIDSFNRALEIDPANAFAYCNRAVAYGEQGNINQAINDLSHALKIEPAYGAAYFNRALFYLQVREFGRSLQDFEEAVRIDPSDAPAHYWLARLLTMCPDWTLRDGARAVQYGLRACELDNEPLYFCALAAAYAEVREFDKAVEMQQRALDDQGFLQGDAEREKTLDDANRQLKLYQQVSQWDKERWLPGESQAASAHQRVEVSNVQGVTVVTFVDSCLWASEDLLGSQQKVDQLQRELFSVAETVGAGNLLLDFRYVAFHGQDVLNVLIKLYKKIRIASGRLILCCLQPDEREVLRVMRLDQLFEIVDSKRQAVESLSVAAPPEKSQATGRARSVATTLGLFLLVILIVGVSVIIRQLVKDPISLSAPAVEIVVPTGFSGPVWIVEDTKAGSPLALVDGRYRAKIPESGILRVSSATPFEQHETQTARYEDGSDLPLYNGSEVAADVVALRRGGGKILKIRGGQFRGGRIVRSEKDPPRSYYPYYVGTGEEARNFLRRPGPVPK